MLIYLPVEIKMTNITAPPMFCLMFIQPPQNFNMLFALSFFLNLYQLATFVLTPLNNLNEITILPLNKIKRAFYFIKTLKNKKLYL